MSFPPDVLLPSNARYVAFVDEKKNYNPNYDIIWSFQYAISGNEGGFATFLTSTKPALSSIPGHYLGYSGTVPLSGFLLDENGNYVLTDDYERIILEGNNQNDSILGLCIAFDSTGLFALSSNTRSGVGLSNIKRNSLIVRDYNDNVTYYNELSNINSQFKILSSGKSYKTMRFKYTNTDKLTIEFKLDGSTVFTELTSININFDPNSSSILRPGFSYSSPISSLNAPGVLFLKNFHTQGTENQTTVETVQFNRM